MKNERRKFIKKSATGLWGATMFSHLPILGKDNKILYSKGLPADMFHEEAKDIPIVEETDVIVCLPLPLPPLARAQMFDS